MFKIGDKVKIKRSSEWYNQQKFDNLGKEIPIIISSLYDSDPKSTYNWSCDNGYLYHNNDLELYNEEINYEIY